MTHQLAPHQARALRAAAAVTGRARRLSAPAALASALVMPLGACGPSDAPLPEWTLSSSDTTPNTAPNTTSQTTPAMTAPEAPETTPTPIDAPPSCVSEAGATDWRCCAAHIDSDVQALGCGLCDDSHSPDGPRACLSCWDARGGADGEGFEDYSQCCEALSGDWERYAQAGCSPWGPPAPPRMRGATITALLGLHTLEVRHACA